MYYHGKKRQIENANIGPQYINDMINEQRIQDEISKKGEEAKKGLWNLRKMKITEIIVKIMSFLWAIIWSITSYICFFSDGHKLLAVCSALLAIGFWVIIMRSAGSVTVLSMEIKAMKKRIKAEKENKEQA